MEHPVRLDRLHHPDGDGDHNISGSKVVHVIAVLEPGAQGEYELKPGQTYSLSVGKYLKHEIDDGLKHEAG